MAKQYWLMKSEPTVFSIDDLVKSRQQTTHWDGVRNYRARNFMRDEMRVGDEVLFYHSNVDPSVVGTAVVVKAGYPDHTAWDPRSKYYDPRSTPENPSWYMVDIRLREKFESPIPLAELRAVPELADMLLLKRGMRLSVQPVRPDEYRVIVRLARRKKR